MGTPAIKEIIKEELSRLDEKQKRDLLHDLEQNIEDTKEESSMSLKTIIEEEYDIVSEGKLSEGKKENAQIAKLLKIGAKATVKMGEDKLYKLSQAFEDWNVDNDDEYDDTVDHLFMAVEIIQDAGEPGTNNVTKDKEYYSLLKDAASHLKKFNKDCVNALKGLKEGLVNESVIGIKTGRDFKGKDLKTALDKAKIKYKMNRLSMTLMVLDLDKKYYDDAKKVVDGLGLSVMLSKESVSEGNNTQYAWSQINNALIKYGMPPRNILRFLSVLNKTNEITEGNVSEEDYKYKKYVSKAFKKLNDAMFDFRHAMGIKQLGQADSKLKNKIDGLHQAVFNLQKEMKSDGLTEGMLTEMDINDPILIAVRARATMIKKAKAAPKVKKISMNQYYKLMDKEIDLITKMKDAAKEFDQMNSDMLQDAGQKGESWSDKDANKWGGGLDKLQTKVETLAKQKLTVKKAIMDYRIN